MLLCFLSLLLLLFFFYTQTTHGRWTYLQLSDLLLNLQIRVALHSKIKGILALLYLGSDYGGNEENVMQMFV